MNYAKIIPINLALDPLIDKVLASKGRLFKEESQAFSDYLSLISKIGDSLVEIADTQPGIYHRQGSRFLAVRYVFVSRPSETRFIEFIPVPSELSNDLTNVENLQGFIEYKSRIRLAMVRERI